MTIIEETKRYILYDNGEMWCKTCDRKMSHGGYGLSGLKKYARYKCNQCGYARLNLNEKCTNT